MISSRLLGRPYVSYGRPREIRRELLERVGEYEGTPLFAEAGRQKSRPEILSSR